MMKSKHFSSLSCFCRLKYFTKIEIAFGIIQEICGLYLVVIRRSLRFWLIWNVLVHFFAVLYNHQIHVFHQMVLCYYVFSGLLDEKACIVQLSVVRESHLELEENVIIDVMLGSNWEP